MASLASTGDAIRTIDAKATINRTTEDGLRGARDVLWVYQ